MGKELILILSFFLVCFLFILNKIFAIDPFMYDTFFVSSAITGMTLSLLSSSYKNPGLILGMAIFFIANVVFFDNVREFFLGNKGVEWKFYLYESVGVFICLFTLCIAFVFLSKSSSKN